jgi:EF hand
MNMFVAASVVAFLAMPLSVGAAGDKASSPSAASSGAERTFDALDKNKDGSLSRDEVKGTPQEKDFAKLDKNNDGKLTRQEHGGEQAATGATAGSGGSAGGAGSTPPPTGGTPSK